MKESYDVLIIGGGPAGLSAALALGRMLRSALVCDDRRPRNAPSVHLNNFPSRDGLHPAKWREEARKDLATYETIGVVETSVATVERQAPGRFLATFSSGEQATFRKVILADGIIDRLPEISGFQELWGKVVLHCPYCHGFEVRDSPLGVVANDNMTLHMATLCSGLTRDLIVFTNGPSTLPPEGRDALLCKGIAVEETPIARLLHDGEVLKAVVLQDGREIPRRALFAARIPPMETKSKIGEQLGCRKGEDGLYQVTEKNETSVPGVYAAGDNMTRWQTVLSACAQGGWAASSVVSELLHEDLLS